MCVTDRPCNPCSAIMTCILEIYGALKLCLPIVGYKELCQGEEVVSGSLN